MGIFVDVSKERAQRVKVVRGVGIVFVIVALSTTDGRPHPDVGNIANAIRKVDRQILLLLHPALVGSLKQTVVTSCHLLLLRRIRQQVTCELFDRELVKRQVAIEGINHVISIRRHIVILIAVVANRVRIAHQIEPVNCHALAVVRRVEQLVHQFPIRRLLVRTFDKRLHHFRRRRQPRQIEVQSPNQRHRVRIRRRFQSLRLQLSLHKPIHPMQRPARLLHLRRRTVLRRDIGPRLQILRSAINPATQDVDLLRLELLVRLRWRHQLVLVRGQNPCHKLARPRLPRAQHFRSPRRRIQSQIRLPLLRIRSMAEEAFVRKDRPHLPIEIRHRCSIGGSHHECGQQQE